MNAILVLSIINYCSASCEVHPNQLKHLQWEPLTEVEGGLVAMITVTFVDLCKCILSWQWCCGAPLQMVVIWSLCHKWLWILKYTHTKKKHLLQFSSVWSESDCCGMCTITIVNAAACNSHTVYIPHTCVIAFSETFACGFEVLYHPHGKV